YIIQELLDAGAKIRAYDPEAMHHVESIFGDQIQFASDPYDALIEADALAIVTEWSVFRAPSFEVLRQILKNPVIFDGRNLYDLHKMEAEGFYYESIGRPIVQLSN
ncbi:MAG: UDP binding domain-containing protein, partial [Saprospiraceae bacterium]